VLKYDDVMNDQRREVYSQRKEFMKAPDVAAIVADMRGELIDQMVERRIPEKAFAEQWETKELAEDVSRLLNLELPIPEWAREEGIDEAHLRERITQAADGFMAAKAANFGPDLMRFIEKSVLLQIFDQVWKEHLLALDHLRQGIVLRAYGQRDPLNEYKTEAFALFNAMLDEMKERVTAMLARAEIAPEPQVAPVGEMTESHPAPEGPLALGDSDYGMAAVAEAPGETMLRSAAVDPNDPSTWRNVGRNAPCPCGSGRKFKHCHGRNV
jgi:preprotein translocase subunit SecA